MQQLIEFATNHALLSGGFVAALLLLLWTEISSRAQAFSTLTPAAAVAFMNRDGSAIVDISTVVDFNKGHILGAQNIPASGLKEPDKETRKLLTKPVLVVCKSGQSANQAAASLVKLGATDVAVLKGGMSQWTSDQYPVKKA